MRDVDFQGQIGRRVGPQVDVNPAVDLRLADDPVAIIRLQTALLAAARAAASAGVDAEETWLAALRLRTSCWVVGAAPWSEIADTVVSCASSGASAGEAVVSISASAVIVTDCSDT